MVFDYLSAYEIFHGFLTISPYLDRVVTSYNSYQLNFRSIVKGQFDLICHHINPNGVTSLILSDGIDTPGQSDLFLSLFQLGTFYTTLRSLSLIDLNENAMQSIMKHIDLFDNLLSLSIINTTSSSPSNLIHIFPQLIRCHISHDWLFANFIPMSQLEHLVVSNRCTYEQFLKIIHYSPKLISLNICLEGELESQIDQLTSNLTRLILNMSLCHVKIQQLKQILIGLTRLIHFEIEARTDLDSCNGYQWELFICSFLLRLKTFNFKFQLNPTITLNMMGIQNLLSSFSSSFWLTEKRWFVAIEWEQRLIYSVPRYSCESADPNFRPPSHCTSPDKTVFYDHITALAVWGQTTHRFVHVQELWLVDNPMQIDLTTLIDIDRVQRLIVVASKIDLSVEKLIDLIRNMRNLYFIQFFDIPPSFNKQERSIMGVEQIRSLELTRECPLSCIKIFSRIFPRLERLRIKIQSNEDIERILKMFSVNLSIIYFDCDHLTMLVTCTWISKIIGHRNFTFALDRSSIRLWIGFGKSSDEIESGETKSRGCFSWCSGRRWLLKR